MSKNVITVTVITGMVLTMIFLVIYFKDRPKSLTTTQTFDLLTR
jgi:hypothetical protein